jgi:L-alanine-DL-glutamate epimerase-like enolase superfamily enzyme
MMRSEGEPHVIDHATASLLRYRLDAPVGGSGVSSVDLVIVDLVDADGATGLGFTYVLGSAGSAPVLAAAREQLERHVLGQSIVPPPALWSRVAAGFNRTGFGPNMLALAAIDVAAWDLHARRRGLPLGTAMGGVSRVVPVYGSGGFSATQAPAEAAAAAERHTARGYSAVKPRVRGARSDAPLLEAVCAVVPTHVQVMADANEKCDLPGARRLLDCARGLGLVFVEEPLPAAALEGYRALARAGGAAVAAGEHLQGRGAFLPFITEHLAAVVQPDLAMAGGLTPILEVAVLCEAFDVALSPHFLPGLFVHVAAASPAVTWLEDFPLIEPLFDGWPELSPAGTLEPRAAPGHGLVLEPTARRRFAV